MIEAIFIATQRRSSQIQKNEIELRAGLGIVGDRNFGKSKYPGQNVTFIEKEEIDYFNANYNQSIGLHSARRNIITNGIRLNELVGKTFVIGDVTFLGVELCEPCKLLGDDIANESLSSASVVKAFVARGGLRADVLNDGVISVGMGLKVQNA